MSKEFIVGVREVHVRYYRVKADNTEAAKDLVLLRRVEAVDMEHSEYSCELESDTWTVEEAS